MLCQVCSANNSDDREYCRRCHNRLLVISGGFSAEDLEDLESAPDEQFSLDEHLLERISILEEVVRRTTTSLRQTVGTLYKLEQKILVNQTGITTLRDLLESKGVLSREEWGELWENRMDYQLLALEKRERFTAIKGQIAALYRGESREAFGQCLEEAELALLSFDIATGVEALERAHQLDPSNHELSFFLAETFFNDGQIEPALIYFERVLDTKSGHFESLVYGGVLHHERGNPERAEDLLRRSVNLFPDAFLPSFSLGAVYASQGRLQQAVVFLEKAVALDPIPQAFFLLGSCCYEMGKSSLAIRRLEETLRLDPTFAGAHHLLGLAYLDRRWYRKALKVLRQGLHLTPSRLRYAELVRLLAEDDAALEVDAALEDDAALEEDAAVTADHGAAETPSDQSLLQQAETLLYGGQRREALSAYRLAVAEEPQNPVLLTTYAMACLELGRWQEIEALVEKVIASQPQEPLRVAAYVTWIEALRNQGRYRDSNRLGNSLLAQEISDRGRSIACYELAWNLAEMEEADLGEALDLARRAVDLSSPELRYLPLAALGWVHFKRRELDQSVELLSASNELDSNPRILMQLGIALLARGDRELARQALQEARRLTPDEAMVDEKVFEVLKGHPWPALG